MNFSQLSLRLCDDESMRILVSSFELEKGEKAQKKKKKESQLLLA